MIRRHPLVRSFVAAAIAGSWLAAQPAHADGPGRIYTQPQAADTGAISGNVKGATLTHAIAVERDRTRVYLATLASNNTRFAFSRLPVGRFDLVLVTGDGRIIEGLALGAAPALTSERQQHLQQAVAKADSFFNRHVRHRAGVHEEMTAVLTERIRDKQILRGSGEELNASLRRIEIIELQQADDDWQMLRTRHIYREEAPRQKDLPFFTSSHLARLGGLRLAGTTRDLGTIDLTPPPPPPSP